MPPPSFDLVDLIAKIHLFIDADMGRIAWNTFLALVPLSLSFHLFYRPQSKFFYWLIHIIMGLGFVYGIRNYNNGSFWQLIKKLLQSDWQIDLLFIASIAIVVSILISIDLVRRKPQDRRSIFWYMTLPIFIVFLPNAPYILTDIIHFFNSVRAIDSVWVLTLIVLPVYILFIAGGWMAYFMSLLNLERYLKFQYLEKFILPTQLCIHLLCAIGIYIGKFLRLNSWNFITNRDILISKFTQELIGKIPFAIILLTFLILSGLYAISKIVFDRLAIGDRYHRKTSKIG
jgi:uncharacterized membrane protein